MKMNLDMSFEEGLNVMEALRKCAIKNGWDEDELDECGVLEEYASAVDAALAAMGIAACIDLDSESELKVEDEDFDDEDWDEDEEDDYFDSDDEDVEEDDCPYTLTPKGEFIVHALEAGVSFENACELADILFDDNEGE
jgi:hypothetical protein